MLQTVQAGSHNHFRQYFLSLSFEERAGFFLWPSLAGPVLTESEKKLLNQIKPSGVILFKRNFVNLFQAKNLIAEIKNLATSQQDPFKQQLFIAIDEEGGTVSRLPQPFTRGLPALDFAERGDIDGLKSQVLYQSAVAKSIGVNCILAPVVDILTEESNPVMGNRCFGRTPETVSEFSEIVAEIFAKEHIFACAKHFPGHGHTTADTHKEAAVSNVSQRILQAREWVPFVNLIKQNVPFIMAAHVIVPELEQDTPATLSYKILTKILREELKFSGLILSDDLRMNAIKHYYKNFDNKQESSIIEEHKQHDSEHTKNDDEFLVQASVQALLAGCDILLSCQSIEKEKIIIQALSDKMANNTDFMDFLCEKAFRISSTMLKI